MNKKFFLITALLVFVAYALVAQSTIVVEEVVFKGEGEACKVPRVKDKANTNNAAVAKINNSILTYFDLESFDPKAAENFSYYSLTFTSQVKSGIVYIALSGEYAGASLNVVEDELFFDLNTGEQVKNTNIPFQSMFSLEGYLLFMNKYWLTDAKKAFAEAIACADSEEPYCSYYDIGSFTVDNSTLSITLDSDCYARALSGCTPELTRSVAMDSVKKYLSPVGEKMLLQEGYANKSSIDKFFYSNQTWKELPENLYLFGLIDGKYPFSMAVTINSVGEVKGFYYYDKRKQKIAITGTTQGGVTQLKETVNGQVTGTFTLRWNSDYQEFGFSVYDVMGNFRYLSGQWKSPDGKKIMPITFTEAKFTNRKVF